VARGRAVETRDGRLHGVLFEAAAPSDDAPLLVCIHGGGCDGRYFDLRGFSLVDRAAAAGFPVLLVDRPGHGRSPPSRSASSIGSGAALVGLLAGELLDGPLAGRKVALIGHSIGAAVALTLAADHGGLALAGVSVSGVGDEPSTEAHRWLAEVRAGTAGHEPSADFFFGPDGSYDWRGPVALRRAGQPWRADEVMEVMEHWPRRFAAIARRIEVPVLFRLAEHERIWRHDAEALSRIQHRFAQASMLDVGLLPAGGHLYEIHKRGREFADEQLAFHRPKRGAGPVAAEPLGNGTPPLGVIPRA
jgi:pimeloyl-ACP methyl ester carboxylesterase